MRAAFPPVNSGGLIEALATSARPFILMSFPPVNSGGLIEAPSCGYHATDVNPGFRR